MADALRPGDEIGRYRVLSTLGEGGMGAVYEATRTDLPLRVALKTMHASLRTRDDAVKRFLREAEALARMRHPHVVDVVDLGVDSAHGPWLAMRLLDGESLAKRLERGGAMSPADALSWALPVAAGLRHAHALGVVHRDLKPDNIFLARTADGHDLPVVIDFGAARYDDGAAPLTVSGVMLGTPFYMAPEQFWGARRATAQSDQYALAFALYESLSGAAPFEAESLVEVIQRVQAGGFEALSSRAPSVSPTLSEAVMRALSVDPAQRFDDLSAFARALLPHASAADRARWSTAFGATPDTASPPPDVVAPAPPVATPVETPVVTSTVDEAVAPLVEAATLDAPVATEPVREKPSRDAPPPSPWRRARWGIPFVVALAAWGAWPRRASDPHTQDTPVPARIDASHISAALPDVAALVVDASVTVDVTRGRAPTRRAHAPDTAAHTPTPAPTPVPAPTPDPVPSGNGADTTPGPRGANGAPIRY